MKTTSLFFFFTLIYFLPIEPKERRSAD